VINEELLALLGSGFFFGLLAGVYLSEKIWRGE